MPTKAQLESQIKALKADYKNANRELGNAYGDLGDAKIEINELNRKYTKVTAELNLTRVLVEKHVEIISSMTETNGISLEIREISEDIMKIQREE